MGPNTIRKNKKKKIRQEKWCRRHFPIGTLTKISYVAPRSRYDIYMKTEYGIVVGYSIHDNEKRPKLIIYNKRGIKEIYPEGLSLGSGPVISIQKPYSKPKIKIR